MTRTPASPLRRCHVTTYTHNEQHNPITILPCVRTQAVIHGRRRGRLVVVAGFTICTDRPPSTTFRRYCHTHSTSNNVSPPHHHSCATDPISRPRHHARMTGPTACAMGSVLLLYIITHLWLSSFILTLPPVINDMLLCPALSSLPPPIVLYSESPSCMMKPLFYLYLV